MFAAEVTDNGELNLKRKRERNSERRWWPIKNLIKANKERGEEKFNNDIDHRKGCLLKITRPDY